MLRRCLSLDREAKETIFFSVFRRRISRQITSAFLSRRDCSSWNFCVLHRSGFFGKERFSINRLIASIFNVYIVQLFTDSFRGDFECFSSVVFSFSLKEKKHQWSLMIVNRSEIEDQISTEDRIWSFSS